MYYVQCEPCGTCTMYNVSLAAHVLCMRFNSHIICMRSPMFFSVVDNDMTLCPFERNMWLGVSVHLFGRI